MTSNMARDSMICLKMAPKMAQQLPRRFHDGSQLPKSSSRRPEEARLRQTRTGINDVCFLDLSLPIAIRSLDGPKMAPEGPKTMPNGAPRRPQGRPIAPHERPEGAPRGDFQRCRGATLVKDHPFFIDAIQYDPKIAPTAAKSVPRAPQERPKGHAPPLPRSPQLPWAAFLYGLVGIREASTMLMVGRCTQ